MADNRLQTVVKDFKESFANAFTEDRDDWARAYRDTRLATGKTEDTPRFSSMAATYPTAVRVRENLGIADPVGMRERESIGMGLEKGPTRRAGQMLGTLVQDIVQDKGRSFYWLLNAIQATGGVIAEETIGRAIPALYKQSPVLNEAGVEITTKMPVSASKMGLIKSADQPFKTRRGVRIKDGVYVKDDYSQGMKAAAALLPSGIAINAGVGLLSPFGGAEGYKAVIPSEEDPNKSANPVLEIASKYLMGRTGNLLPYEQYKEVRPDVSKDEYGAYKAFKYDKRLDLNPFDDGKVVGPMGLFKANADGLQGPEVELLGKTLPVNTGIVPYASALAGGVLGGRAGVKSKRAASGALLGGLGGLALGTGAGNAIEQERRRRRLNDDPDGGQDTIGMGYM
jgi:hypothetical protein